MKNRLKFQVESASCDLVRLQDDLYSLRNLRAKSLGRGHAGMLLKQVCSWADEMSVTLVLIVRAAGRIENGKMNDQELTEFYGRHGFISQRGNSMLREFK